jgi:hypothetical protein
MSIVGRYAYPIADFATARLAVGRVMANHSRELSGDDGESLGKTSKDMGTEVNVGLDFSGDTTIGRPVDYLVLRIVGAYAIPGSYYSDILGASKAKRKDAWGFGIVLSVGF